MDLARLWQHIRPDPHVDDHLVHAFAFESGRKASLIVPPEINPNEAVDLTTALRVAVAKLEERLHPGEGEIDLGAELVVRGAEMLSEVAHRPDVWTEVTFGPWRLRWKAGKGGVLEASRIRGFAGWVARPPLVRLPTPMTLQALHALLYTLAAFGPGR